MELILVKNTSTIHRKWCQATIRHHKSKDLIIDITIDKLFNFVRYIENCFYCERKLAWGGKDVPGVLQDNSPTLERLNNEKVINIDNIAICCHACNRKKSNRTLKEFVIHCNVVVERFGNG